MSEDGVQDIEERLRRGMARVLGPEAGVVPGEAVLEELFPLERRRELWKKWEVGAEIKLPLLDHSLSTKMGWFAGGFIAALFLLSALRLVGVPMPASVMAGGVLGVVLGAIGLRLFAGKAVEFPAGVRTIHDLAVRMEMRRQ
ncbi:MAG: hypothetical protein ABI972_18445 [Acidobacteriota bacterium]